MFIVAEPPIYKSTMPFPSFVPDTVTTTSSDFTIEEASSDGNQAVLSYVLTCIPQEVYYFALAVNASRTNLSVTITGLHPGATYDCHYQAVNTIGASNRSLSTALRLNDDSRSSSYT